MNRFNPSTLGRDGRHRAIAWIIAAGLLAPADDAQALDPGKRLTQYPMKVWQTDEGLPNIHVQALLQTRDQYLWVGTEEGVARFDGVQFTVFDRDNTPSLASNSVWGFVEAADGTLWIATLGGLTRYRAGQWSPALTEADGLPSERLNCIAPGRDGALWIGTQSGLARFHNGRIERVQTEEGAIDDEITALVEDADGTLWMGGQTTGVVRFRDGRVRRYTVKDGLGSNSINSLALAGGALWIGTTRGVSRLEHEQVTTYSGAHGLGGDDVNRVLVDRAGTVWVGTIDGLNRREGERFALLTKGDGLPANTVEVLYEDRAGSLWIGTNGGGLARMSDGKFTAFTQRQGLPSDTVSAGIEDSQGTIWLGTYGGLVALEREGRIVTHAGPRRLAGDSVRAIATRRDGGFWLGTQGNGVFYFENGRFVPYLVGKIRGAAPRAIHETADGTLWVGTRDGGLNRVKDGVVTVYTTREGLAHNGVTSIRETSDGNLWVGTISGGLSRLEQGRFRTYTTRDGLPGDDVLALATDAIGTLWIGTSRGLGRFHDGRFRVYTKRQGLCDDTVLSLVEDAGGDIWTGSNKGICRTPRRQLDDLDAGRIQSVSSTLFTTADGLPSNEAVGVNQDSAWRDRHGRLWFGINTGVARIDPANIPVDRAPPSVDIHEVRLDKAIVSGTVHPPNDGELEFRYTAPGGLHPEKTTFKWLLEGFDREWTNAYTRRVAYYTNIPPASYRFRVLAFNEAGVSSEVSYAFRLRPHVHQTRWFAALCAGGLAGVAFAAYRLRVQGLRRRERELKAAVAEATASLKILRGLLPICSSCKKIRDDGGYWTQLEKYLREHSEADLSHAICPDCLLQLYPDYEARMRAFGALKPKN